jgi:hypothetical protein
MGAETNDYNEPVETTLLGFFWHMREESPDRMVERLVSELTGRRVKLCGILRNERPEAIAASVAQIH